ncbi:MAG TPA: hypothetical protein VGG16_20445 [Streptosporangiaceae bacterium]
MDNVFRGRHGRAARWAAGVTLAGFLAGGGVALASGAGSANAASQSGTGTSNAQLNALLSASSGTSSAAATPGTATHRIRSLRRLRGLGGMYGSFTLRTKSGDETLAFERGTIKSVGSSDVVVRAPDGTTMTWLLVSNSVVRDHGKSSTKQLSAGQLVFVGGAVASGARDARLIVVRTGRSATTSVG